MVEARDPFNSLSLAELRTRTSEKWATYPEDVLPAFVAEMDFPLADPIKHVLLEAVEHGDTGYAFAQALPGAFAEFARAWFDWTVDPARVFVVPDVIVGVAEALSVITKPGSGVVVDAPTYPPFFTAIPEYERKVVNVPLLRTPRGWDLNFDALESAFKAGAQAYLLCNPHNPTGRVFSRADLERVAGLAARYGVAVLSDENHAPLTLAGAIHTPFVSLGEEIASNAVTVISAAKAFNLAGLKCAVVVAGSDEMRTRLTKLPRALPFRASHFGVLAAIAAYRQGSDWLRSLNAHLDRNRKLLAQLLAAQLPAIRYIPPEASYLAWLDCTDLGLGRDPAAHFLKHGRVALTGGLHFGPTGDGFARLNIGTTSALLTEAVARMAASLA